MRITNPELKFVIIDLLKFEDKVDGKGQRIQRGTYPKAFFKPTMKLQEKLMNDVELLIKDPLKEEPFWKNHKEVGSKDTPFVIGERIKEDELDITEDEIKAIKHFYNEREEIRACSIETLEELERIIK